MEQGENPFSDSPTLLNPNSLSWEMQPFVSWHSQGAETSDQDSQEQRATRSLLITYPGYGSEQLVGTLKQTGPSKGKKENSEKWRRLERTLVLISKIFYKVPPKRTLWTCSHSWRDQHPRLEPQYWHHRGPSTSQSIQIQPIMVQSDLSSLSNQVPTAAATDYLQMSTLGPYQALTTAPWVLAQVYPFQVPWAQSKLKECHNFFEGGPSQNGGLVRTFPAPEISLNFSIKSAQQDS